MKAFISSSLHKSESYILSQIALKINEWGFTINNFYSDSKFAIDNSHIFIGIISEKGTEQNKVIEDWKYAKSLRIPNFLLVEDTILLTESYKASSSVIQFNRYYPQQAVEEIRNKIDSFKKQAANQPVIIQPNNTANNNDEVWGWILGGAAVLGIAALLAGAFSKAK